MGKSSGMTPMQKRVAEQRKQQQAKDRRLKIIFTVVIVAVIAIAAIVIGVLVSQSKNSNNTGANGAAATKIEKEVQAKYGNGQPIQLGDKGQKISLYFDYSCPHCAEYELLVGPAIMKEVDAGKATLLLHPVNTVALPYNDAATAAVLRTSIAQPDKLQKFHEQLLDYYLTQMRTTGVDQFRDPAKAIEQVRKVAKDVGVSDSTLEGLTATEAKQYLEKSSQNWANANIKGVNKDQLGTPMYVRDDTVVSLQIPLEAPGKNASQKEVSEYNKKAVEYLKTTWVQKLITGK